MKCSQCGYESKENLRFCGNCGVPAARGEISPDLAVPEFTEPQESAQKQEMPDLSGETAALAEESPEPGSEDSAAGQSDSPDRPINTAARDRFSEISLAEAGLTRETMREPSNMQVPHSIPEPMRSEDYMTPIQPPLARHSPAASNQATRRAPAAATHTPPPVPKTAAQQQGVKLLPKSPPGRPPQPRDQTVPSDSHNETQARPQTVRNKPRPRRKSSVMPAKKTKPSFGKSVSRIGALIAEAFMKKPLYLRRMILLMPLLLAVIAVILVLSFGGEGEYPLLTNGIEVFASNGVTLVSGNNNSVFTIYGEYISMQKSLDGSAAALLVQDGRNTALYYITLRSARRVADNAQYFMISDTGGGIAYVTDAWNDRGVLHIFDTASGRSTQITHTLYTLAAIQISPDGRTVAYGSGPDIDGSWRSYIKSGSAQAEFIGYSFEFIAVADAGRLIYYTRQELDGRSLHVRAGNSTVMLSPLLPLHNGRLLFNRDYSQAVFTFDGRAFISVNGGDRELLAPAPAAGLVLPPLTGYLDRDGVKIYNLRSFAGKVLKTSDYDLHKISDGLETSKIATTLEGGAPVLASGGRDIYFIDPNGRLGRLNLRNANASIEALAEDVYCFAVCRDGRIVYYLTAAGELMAVRGSREPVRIANDTHSLALAAGGTRVFFLYDYKPMQGTGTLLTSNNGGERSAVDGGRSVTRVWSTPTSVFFEKENADGEISVYRSSGGVNFERLTG